MDLRKIGLAAVAACACLASVARAAPPPGMPDGWSDGFAYSNGARLHYYRAVPNPGNRHRRGKLVRGRKEASDGKGD